MALGYVVRRHFVLLYGYILLFGGTPTSCGGSGRKNGSAGGMRRNPTPRPILGCGRRSSWSESRGRRNDRQRSALLRCSKGPSLDHLKPWRIIDTRTCFSSTDDGSENCEGERAHEACFVGACRLHGALRSLDADPRQCCRLVRMALAPVWPMLSGVHRRSTNICGRATCRDREAGLYGRLSACPKALLLYRSRLSARGGAI